MAIKSGGDLMAAYQAGQSHAMRICRTSSSSGTSANWNDWSMGSGQPSYDAHIGTALAFTPKSNSPSSCLWLPPAAGMDRRLVSMTMGAGISTSSISIYICDFIGFYSQIDGDSSSLQSFDNSTPLPRYANGEGVQMFLVQNVAPATSAGVATITYTDTLGVSQQTTFNVNAATSIGTIINGTIPGSANLNGSAFIPLSGNGRGVASVQSIQFGTAPSGNHALCLVKPITQWVHNDDAPGTVTGPSQYLTDKEFMMQSAGICPSIPEGCQIMMLNRSSVSATPVFFGELLFVWG